MSRQSLRTKKGIIFIMSGPSGVGKGTIREKVLKQIPDLIFSVSVTTRKKRPGEIDGKDYIFVSREKFEEMIRNNELLEWAEVYGNYYGTPSKIVEKALIEGKDVLLEIDVQGAKNVKRRYPEAVSIFIFPPSVEDLILRLKKRATETQEEFQRRIEKAKREMDEVIYYNYVVVNDKLEDAILRVKCIILAERAKIV